MRLINKENLSVLLSTYGDGEEIRNRITEIMANHILFCENDSLEVNAKDMYLLHLLHGLFE